VSELASEPLSRRAVLVIGGSSPIGVAIATAFSAGGDRVTGVALEARADPVFEHFLVANCAVPAEADRVVESTVDRLGRLDVVVLAAALMPVASAMDTTDEQWRAAHHATLDTAFFVTRAALRHLAAGSSIVAVSSVNAFLAAPGVPAYASSKAGLEGLVRQLALEYGPTGIRVNAVAPAMIGNARLPAVREGYPLCRTGKPEEVAAAVRFLASAEASFITGVTLPVDGGLSIASPAAFLRPDLRSRFL
jgi:meso-butanediol dehydrogenase / (S,S)-butanediol dehydrogenase / diacetyl reductase